MRINKKNKTFLNKVIQSRLKAVLIKNLFQDKERNSNQEK